MLLFAAAICGWILQGTPRVRNLVRPASHVTKQVFSTPEIQSTFSLSKTATIQRLSLRSADFDAAQYELARLIKPLFPKDDEIQKLP